MPKASRVDLIKTVGEQFDKMWKLIDSIALQQQMTVFNFYGVTLGKEVHWSRDKNVRDVFVHFI